MIDYTRGRLTLNNGHQRQRERKSARVKELHKLVTMHRRQRARALGLREDLLKAFHLEGVVGNQTKTQIPYNALTFHWGSGLGQRFSLSGDFPGSG